MGCGVSCPAIRIDADWELEDPYGGPLQQFKDTAAIIEQNIKLL